MSRGADTLGRVSIFYKGDNICDFLYVFLHTKPLLERGLSKGNNILSVWSRLILEMGGNISLTE